MSETKPRSTTDVVEQTNEGTYDDLRDAIDAVVDEDVETKICFGTIRVTDAPGDTLDAAHELTSALHDVGVDLVDGNVAAEDENGTVEFFASVGGSSE